MLESIALVVRLLFAVVIFNWLWGPKSESDRWSTFLGITHAIATVSLVIVVTLPFRNEMGMLAVVIGILDLAWLSLLRVPWLSQRIRTGSTFFVWRAAFFLLIATTTIGCLHWVDKATVASVRDFVLQQYFNPTPWIVLLTFYVGVLPTGTVIGLITKGFSDALDDTNQGLANAGRWIGRLERFLVIAFMLAEQHAAIALLITAKGILRFGEIKAESGQGADPRKMIEYVLIGSLFSIGTALVLGWIARTLLDELCLQRQVTP